MDTPDPEELARRLGLSAEELRAAAFDGPLPCDEPQLEAGSRKVRPVPGATDQGTWLISPAGESGEQLAPGGDRLVAMRRAGRMAAVRELAGRLAHELNNSLMALSGYSELLQLDPELSQRGELTGIRRATERVAGLSRKLLQFSGRWAVDRQPLPAAKLVAMLLDRASARLPGRLKVRPGGSGELSVDADAIGTALDALLDNANEADPEGAVTITATTERLVGPEPLILHPRRAGDFLQLTIRDQGPGMSPELLARACEPLVTTHRERKAEGMGLSVVFGLLALHEGALALDMAEGGGLRCRLWLPLL